MQFTLGTTNVAIDAINLDIHPSNTRFSAAAPVATVDFIPGRLEHGQELEALLHRMFGLMNEGRGIAKETYSPIKEEAEFVK